MLSNITLINNTLYTALQNIFYRNFCLSCCIQKIWGCFKCLTDIMINIFYSHYYIYYINLVLKYFMKFTPNLITSTKNKFHYNTHIYYSNL